MTMTLTEQKESWLKKYTAKEILGPWTYAPGGIPTNDVEETVLVYDNDLYIEIMEDHYYLMIENCEWVSEDLCYLEEELAEYRLDSGYMPYIEYEAEEKAEAAKDKIVDDIREFALDFIRGLNTEELEYLKTFNIGEYLRDCILDNIYGSK